MLLRKIEGEKDILRKVFRQGEEAQKGFIMTNTETKRREIPEILMTAMKQRVERRVEELSLFLLPLPSERARALLKRVKDLGAAVEFASETEEEYEDCSRILEELIGYCSAEFYYDVLSECALTLEQQKLLINMAIVYYNAKKMVNQCYVESGGDPAGVLKHMTEWSEAAMKTVQILLISMGNGVVEEELCQVMTPKVCRMNGILLSFEKQLRNQN